MEVLGVQITDIDSNKAIELVGKWLVQNKKRYIVTPNPEIIIQAKKDFDLQSILNDADLSIPDGVGLKLAGVKNRIAGVDFMLDLVKLAAENGYKIGLLGAKKGVAQKVKSKLTLKYPKLNIVFADDGGLVNNQGISSDSYSTISKNKSVDILFVAFGSRKQEKWIAQNLDKIPVKVAMAVGGSFDYISGDVSRAPKIMRDLGLEWLFRLITQPWRVKRQLSLMQFIWLLLKSKYI